MKPRSELDDEPIIREHPTPQYWMGDDEVAELEFDYDDRAPTDFVISGPLAGTDGPGRSFPDWDDAEKWAREKYGSRFKRRMPAPEDSPRWAFLIRK